MSGGIAQLPEIAVGGMLVLCRVAAVVALLPGLSEAEAPVMLRAGLAACLSMLLYPLIDRAAVDAAMMPAELVRAVVREFATGLLLGWMARLVALALPLAGQFVSVFTGLTSVVQPDPSLGAQASALARLFGLAAPALLLASGLYALPIEALVGSYRLIPLGGAPAWTDSMVAVMHATGEMFGLALRLAAPFVLAGTVWQVGLGVLSKFVPTLQAGAALIPGQVLGGMLLLALLARTMLWEWGDATSRGLMALPGFGLAGAPAAGG